MENNVEYLLPRDGFGRGLEECAEENENVFAMGGDMTFSVGMDYFAKRFPSRFISLGIAEQNAIAFAAGLALMNKIPVYATYATFITFRAADQIRISVCYNNLHVIIVGAHAGISVGPDGATHQALEDIALMRSLPNMTVLSPCDATQTNLAIKHAIQKHNGPIYIRFGREAVPNFSSPQQHFEIGKGQILHSGSDVCILATGNLTWYALQAAKILQEENIQSMVINIHTIKPLDKELIISAAEYCGAFVTCEEHQIMGGFGSAIAELIAKEYPIPIEFIGIDDTFGESGPPSQLMKKYKLTAPFIVDAVKKVLPRKK